MRPFFSIATLLVLLILSAFSSPAAAADAVASVDSQAILAQQQEIRAAATARQERYKDMEEARMKELFAHQDNVTRLLSGTTQTTELSERDKIAVFNSLEAIAGIVNRAEDERMICERYKPVGSNRPQRVCKTVAERRAEREADTLGQRDQRCVDAWNSGACAN